MKDDTLLTDLARINTLVEDEKLETIKNVVLDVGNSFEQLQDLAPSIESIEYKAHPLLKCRYNGQEFTNFGAAIEQWLADSNDIFQASGAKFEAKQLDI